jgi:hypothetical protein
LQTLVAADGIVLMMDDESLLAKMPANAAKFARDWFDRIQLLVKLDGPCFAALRMRSIVTYPFFKSTINW